MVGGCTVELVGGCTVLLVSACAETAATVKSAIVTAMAAHANKYVLCNG